MSETTRIYKKPKTNSIFKLSKSVIKSSKTLKNPAHEFNISSLLMNKPNQANKINISSILQNRSQSKELEIDSIIERNSKRDIFNLTHSNNLQYINKPLLKDDEADKYESLQVSIEKGDFNEFKEIFNKDNFEININLQITKFQETALHIAIEQGYNNIINFLLEKGANPNIQQQDGETSLHYALKYNHSFKVVKLLLLYKANPQIKTLKTKETSIDYARNDPLNEKCLEILLKNLTESNRLVPNVEDYNREFSFKPSDCKNESFLNSNSKNVILNYSSPISNPMSYENKNVNYKKDSKESKDSIQDTLIIHSSKFCNLEEKLKYIQLNSLSNTNTNISNLISNNNKQGVPSIYNFYNYNYNYSQQHPNTPMNHETDNSNNYSLGLAHLSSNSVIEQLRLPTNKSNNDINYNVINSNKKKHSLHIKRNGSVISGPGLDVLSVEQTDRIKDIKSFETGESILSCDIVNDTPKREALSINIFTVKDFNHNKENKELSNVEEFLSKLQMGSYTDILLNNGLDDIQLLKDDILSIIKMIIKYSYSLSLKSECLICKLRSKILNKIVYNKFAIDGYLCICNVQNDSYPLIGNMENVDLLLKNIGISKGSDRITIILSLINNNQTFKLDMLNSVEKLIEQDQFEKWFLDNNFSSLIKYFKEEGFSSMRMIYYQILSIFPFTVSYLENMFNMADKDKNKEILKRFIIKVSSDAHNYYLNDSINKYSINNTESSSSRRTKSMTRKINKKEDKCIIM